MIELNDHEEEEEEENEEVGSHNVHNGAAGFVLADASSSRSTPSAAAGKMSISSSSSSNASESLLRTRIISWLQLNVEFAYTVCDKTKHSMNVILELILKAWPGLLIVSMIENHAEFLSLFDQVTPKQRSTTSKVTTTNQDDGDNNNNNNDGDDDYADYDDEAEVESGEELDGGNAQRDKAIGTLRHIVATGGKFNMPSQQINDIKKIFLFRESTYRHIVIYTCL